MSIIAIDTETTGLDAFHGAKPYFVTICDSEGNQSWWEWDVDPLTRQPVVPYEDLEEIFGVMQEADRLVFQNSKFDMRMLDMLGFDWKWDWSKIHELGISSHLLGSCQRKDLTTLALVWLGINLEPVEKAVQKATEKARRICRSKAFKETNGEWAIAHDDRKDMPSGSHWKADMWLLRAMIKHAPDFVPDWGTFYSDGETYEPHPWEVLCAEYANPDSATTVQIHMAQMEKIEKANLLTIYDERRKLLPVVYQIEKTGVTVSLSRTEELIEKFESEANTARDRCLALSDGILEKLPLSGASNDLKSVVFEKFKLVSPKKTDKGHPSLDKEVLEHWLQTLPPNSKARIFIRGLQSYRKRMTAINYMRSYERFGLEVAARMLRLHPSLNMNGTNTLRWSSSNPNEQNISKQEGFNLRYTFGPPPGFLWASLDYENLELRIPAYEAEEELLTQLFEEPDKPPFYGSNHLLNFSTIYPELWEPLLQEYGPEKAADAVKHKYKSTWYQRCKNGWFAIQYGSVEIEGKLSTADKSFGKPGAHRTLKQKLGRLDQLNQKYILEAQKTGFVHTIPDQFVDPTQGYPLECSRNGWGKISPTIPLNYHVQGTACWIIMQAMLQVSAYLDDLNAGKPSTRHWSIVMQIHDELVIQFPNRPGYSYHLEQIRKLMADCGIRINVPLRVGCEVHKSHWASGEKL
jgi:DNA polymerase I-like protein with 3'-5' exonuclease and polymerase domains